MLSDIILLTCPILEIRNKKIIFRIKTIYVNNMKVYKIIF